MGNTSVLIVDDNVVIRQGLRSLLDIEDGISVEGEASTGAEAIQWAKTNSAAVILMDIRMPVVDGIEATAEIMNLKPESRILILTVTEDPPTLARSLASGARGYLVYSLFAPEELLSAIRGVAAGHCPPVSSAVELALADLSRQQQTEQYRRDQSVADPLTSRENEILDLIAEGKSNAEIARALVVEEKTVKNHITSLYSKLGIGSRYEAIRFKLGQRR